MNFYVIYMIDWLVNQTINNPIVLLSIAYQGKLNYDISKVGN